MAESEHKFELVRIYAKDISFEAPMGASIYSTPGPAKTSVDIQTKVQPLDEDKYEVVLTIAVTGKKDDQTAFVIEVEQAGIFVTGVKDGALRQALGVLAPVHLYPYAREAIDGLALRGGLPPIVLQPVDFSAMYFEGMRKEKEAAESH